MFFKELPSHVNITVLLPHLMSLKVETISLHVNMFSVAHIFNYPTFSGPSINKFVMEFKKNFLIEIYI